MTKKAISNALFCAILAAALAGTSILVKPDNESYNILSVTRTEKQIDEEPENTLDILMIGDSLVYTAYDPIQIYRESGYTSFNAATISQRICDSYALLKDTFESQELKLVILDMDVITRPAEVYEEESEFLTLFGKIFPILHYHSVYKLLKSPKEMIQNTDPEETSGFKNKGYSRKDKVTPYEGDDNYMEEDSSEFTIDSSVSEYLLKIRDLCKEQNAELLLITTPSPVNWDAAKNEACTQWAEENNVDYLDMNLHQDEVNMDWQNDTPDGGDHLNFRGAEKTTSFLTDYIAVSYDLEDHRGDEAFASWDRLAEQKDKGGKNS